MSHRITLSTGSALLESILGIALLSLFFVILAGSITYVEVQSFSKTLRAEGMLSSTEGLEAVRSMRNESYTLLVPGVHGLSRVNNRWQFTGENDTALGITREIQIVALDASTTEVVARATWGENPHSAEVSYSTILTNWQ